MLRQRPGLHGWLEIDEPIDLVVQPRSLLERVALEFARWQREQLVEPFLALASAAFLWYSFQPSKLAGSGLIVLMVT